MNLPPFAECAQNRAIYAKQVLPVELALNRIIMIVLSSLSRLLRPMVVSLLLAPGMVAHAEDPLPAKVRVGTYDSRLVAVAYTASEGFQKRLVAMQAEVQAAMSKGDQERVQVLQRNGRALQERVHKQGFSTWPIHDILKLVDKKLPLIAREAKVGLIVSKWDLAYRHANTEAVDVTPQLVELFNPNEKTRNILKSLATKEPVPLESLQKGHRGQ